MFLNLSNEIFNTVHLGFCFLLLFSADFTLNNLMPTLYKRIKEDNPDFTINGFVELSGLYFVYGISLWLAPSINAVIGPKIGMVIGALGIAFHIFVIEFETVWLVYVAIFFSGFGGSLLWVGEGNYVVLNSKTSNITKHVSVFWALYTGAMVIGNLYMTFQLGGRGGDLNAENRTFILRVLTCISVVAACFFSLLRNPTGMGDGEVIHEGPVQALVKTFKLYMTKEMMCLFFTFIYAGFQQSFGWGIYETCMGYTKRFGPGSIQLVPLSGLTYGLGNTLGGVFHMTVSHKKIIKFQRGIIICLSGVIQTTALILTFVNLPNESVFNATEKMSLIEPSVGLGLACSFLLGFGDSCLNTQIFSLLAFLHPDHSAHTSALYKFTKCMAMAGFFFVGISIGLHYQLLMIGIACFFGTLAFFWVDFKTCEARKSYPVCVDLL